MRGRYDMAMDLDCNARGGCQHCTMMKPLFVRLIALFCCAAVSAAQAESDVRAQQLAQEVWKASGGEQWGNVGEMRFTFVVEQDGKQLIAAEHHWDIVAGTDHVKWKDKEATVNLAASADDENSQAAYARWVNDSYWLLAPLKVLDSGVKLAHEGTRELQGVACETLRLSFEQVGLTPSDQYVLYIDPATSLVRAWDYIPKEGAPMHSTWENYETFGGLRLATMHNFAGKVIRFANVEVVMRK